MGIEDKLPLSLKQNLCMAREDGQRIDLENAWRDIAEYLSDRPIWVDGTRHIEVNGQLIVIKRGLVTVYEDGMAMKQFPLDTFAEMRIGHDDR